MRRKLLLLTFIVAATAVNSSRLPSGGSLRLQPHLSQRQRLLLLPPPLPVPDAEPPRLRSLADTDACRQSPGDPGRAPRDP